MRIQLLSDLHLETETYAPEPAPGAELLVLAGDIDSTWASFDLFRDWPQPILLVAGNHEFDGRDLTEAWPVLRGRCEALSITLLECESTVRVDAAGRRIRFVGTTRWSDFDCFGPARREKAMRAASYFMQLMGATQDGAPYDAEAVRADALRCRAWLERRTDPTGRRLGRDRGRHPLRTERAERRSALRPAKRDGELLQRRRRPARARAALDSRPPALHA